MSEIRSMKPTKEYRAGWDRIFGKKNNKSPHWYKIYLCEVCEHEVSRERQYGTKPKDKVQAYSATRVCSSCWEDSR